MGLHKSECLVIRNLSKWGQAMAARLTSKKPRKLPARQVPVWVYIHECMCVHSTGEDVSGRNSHAGPEDGGAAPRTGCPGQDQGLRFLQRVSAIYILSV